VDHEFNSGVGYVAGSHRQWRLDEWNDLTLMRVPDDKKPLDYVRALPEGITGTGMTGDDSRNGMHSGESILPGAAVVPIKSGQTVFWNGDGLHRGVNAHTQSARSCGRIPRAYRLLVTRGLLFF